MSAPPAASESLGRKLARVIGRLVWHLTYGRGEMLASELRKRWVILKNPKAEIRFEGYCRIQKGFDLDMRDGGRFLVGKYVDFRQGFRAEVGREATVRIGDLCVFTPYTLIQCNTSIDIGERSMFGQSSLIVDGNHRFRDVSKPLADQGYDYRQLKIGDHVTTMTKVTITNDVGTRAVVAANSVVAKPVPPYTLVGGVPARLLDYWGPPELTPPEWEERRSQQGVAVPERRPGRLEVSGHSVPFGGGVSAFEQRFTTTLSELLDIEEVNRSVPAAIACWHEVEGELGRGGYAHVLQEFRRPADVTAQHEQPFAALTNYGINDLALLGPGDLEPFRHALRTILSRHRASAVFEEDHPSVTYEGAWGRRPADGPDCSGEAAMETGDEGASLKIVLPEEFPGGTVALGFVAVPGADARLEVGVDGQQTATLDTSRATESLLRHRNGVVVRLPGLSPGVHTIVCTVEKASGPVVFDYWQVEPEPGPRVIVPLAYRSRDWSKHYSDWPHMPSDAAAGRLNETIREVVAEFGEGAIAVDVDVLEQREELFSWDGFYPNDEGHRLIAEAIAAAVR